MIPKKLLFSLGLIMNIHKIKIYISQFNQVIFKCRLAFKMEQIFVQSVLKMKVTLFMREILSYSDYSYIQNQHQIRMQNKNSYFLLLILTNNIKQNFLLIFKILFQILLSYKIWEILIFQIIQIVQSFSKIIPKVIIAVFGRNLKCLKKKIFWFFEIKMVLHHLYN